MQGVQDGKNLSAEAHEERPDHDSDGFPLPSRLHDLVKTVELEALCHFESLAHGRHLFIGKNDCLFLGEMKDDPLLFDLQIAAEYFQEFEQAEREPTFIVPHVHISVEVDENRKEKQQCSDKCGINKKFAHTESMCELFVFIRLLGVIFPLRARSLPPVLCALLPGSFRSPVSQCF